MSRFFQKKPTKTVLGIFLGLSLTSLSGCLDAVRESKLTTSSQASTQGSTAATKPISSTPGTQAVQLNLLPKSGTYGIGRQVTFTTGGGSPPYRYSVLSGVGSIATDGTYSAGYVPGPATVMSLDNLGRQAISNIEVAIGANQTPNDTDFGFQYALHNATGADIKGPEAWAINTDCSNTLVGTLDTGVDYTHPDLASNLYTNPGEIPGNGVDDDGNGLVDDSRGWNFSGSNNDPKDDHFHGTHVAGIIGAVTNNGAGVAGICWKASIYPIKVFDSTGSGFSSDVATGMDYAVKMHVKILNASFDFPTNSATLSQAIDRLNAANILLVVAAGNDGVNIDTNPTYPASYASPNILTVAATDANDALASFSNYAKTSVHIAAPGNQIASTFPTYMTTAMTTGKFNKNYEFISGTSMATPMVVGAAALLWSFDPRLTMVDVRSRILAGADVLAGLNGKVLNGKRLNLRKTLYGQ